MEDFENFIISKLHKISCDPCVNDKTMNIVISLTKSIVEKLINMFNDEIEKHVSSKKKEISKLNIPKTIEKLTLFRLNAIIKKPANFVDVQLHTLGSRTDVGYVDGRYMKHQVEESMYFFNIYDTVMCTLNNKKKFDKAIANQIAKQYQSCEKEYKTDLDGRCIENFSNDSSDLLKLRITFYCDDIEVVNPLGSSTGKHKLSMFYFTINNLEQIGSLSNVYWYGAAYSDDLKKYGNKKVLAPLIDELKKLKKGVEISLHGFTLKLEVLLVAVTGDTLALHELFELKSPSAKYFCRVCLINRDEFHKNITCAAPLRTSEIEKMPKKEQEAVGVRGLCVLSEVGFDFTKNMVFDILHDLLEGCSGLIAKLILKFYLEQKVLTAEELNRRVRNFEWGYMNQLDKPSDNFTAEYIKNDKKNTLKQKGVQTWYFIRALPFLLYDLNNKIADQVQLEKIKRLLTYHLAILRICFSFKITLSQVIILNTLFLTFVY